MLHNRVIPCLLLSGGGLVKTEKFRNPVYVGDPINAVKIFNDKEVDELVFLDILASRESRGPAVDVIQEIASECFMPLAYGGGIGSVAVMQRVLAAGVEKVILNSIALRDSRVVTDGVKEFGSQSVVVSIDVKKRTFGRYEVFALGGRKATGEDPVEFARRMEDAGAGEILLNSIDRDGTMRGYDIALTRRVAEAVSIPVVACGGAGVLSDFVAAVHEGGASAVAAGSMFVFHGKHKAVLISYPSPAELKRAFSADQP